MTGTVTGRAGVAGAMRPSPLHARHVFDCDGVLMDTARMKAEVFREAAKVYGQDAVDLMDRIHRSAGSAGRRYRVEEFLLQLLGDRPSRFVVEQMLADITARLLCEYATAELVPGVERFLEVDAAPLLVVSGIEQSELEHILELRGLADRFAGIYGGNKREILPRLVAEGVIAQPAWYYGDEEHDYRAATEAGLHFVHVAHCSDWTPPEGVRSIADFNEVLP